MFLCFLVYGFIGRNDSANTHRFHTFVGMHTGASALRTIHRHTMLVSVFIVCTILMTEISDSQ